MQDAGFRPSKTIAFLRAIFKNELLVLAVLAVCVGFGVGWAVVGFRSAISWVQFAFIGEKSETFSHVIAAMTWYQVLAIPATGGLIVGLILRFLMPDQRPKGPADVIEAEVAHAGKIDWRSGLLGALTSAVSIGTGGSVGREGPAVHLGAAFSSWIAQRLKLTRSNSRLLLGCGVAAAVASSFNAPIAGALFAHEVVMGHFAVNAFAPVVIASVSATLVTRAVYGSYPAFQTANGYLVSVLEFPAFVGLGLLASLCALALIHGILKTQKAPLVTKIPSWMRPMCAGFLVGGIALYYPQVLGVGYEATDSALNTVYPLALLAALLVAKLLATIISLGLGMAGGVFSPSLVIGAMLGGAYGHIATQIFPHLSSGGGAYTLVGMAAVASAVLGAPISTTLIAFELTGDYALTIAVMVGAVVATVATQQLGVPSFFRMQLRQRGVDLTKEFETSVLQDIQVGRAIRYRAATFLPDTSLIALRTALLQSASGLLCIVDEAGKLVGTVSWMELGELAFDRTLEGVVIAQDVMNRQSPHVHLQDTLATAQLILNESTLSQVPVIKSAADYTFVATLGRHDISAAISQAMMKAKTQESTGA